MAVRVVQHSGHFPDCFLDLEFPKGDEGIRSRPDDENPLFVRDEKLLGSEANRWDAMLGDFHAVACRKGPDHCEMDEQSGPFAYARHLVPGTALQTYRFLCSAFDPNNGPSEVWLLRTGHDPVEINATSTELRPARAGGWVLPWFCFTRPFDRTA